MHSSNAEIPALSPAFTNLAQAKYQDEQSAARQIQDACQLSAEQSLRADAMGHLLSQKLRIARQNQAGIDNLLSQYPLSTPAGRALLNLAEAALRIPDHFQLDQFIEEQLHAADWHQHRGHSPSWLINFATLGLDLAESTHTPLTTPIFREAIKQALRLLASQFVIAEDITAALQAQNPDFRYSFDMLGEAALSPEEASVYLERYTQAIHQVGAYSQGAGQFGPAVSIKLSALCHKFDFLHYQQVHTELYPRLYQLALIAKQYDIGLTIDAEESHRQLLTLSLFERLMAEPDLLNWSGLGIAIQAYQKNALQVVKWLSQSTRQQHRAITVRLVKGAYWDSEIKWAQQAGLANYPVWTNKTLTDQSYLACARVLLQAENRIFAQFATHNAFTLSTIHQMAGTQNCEFQALFGMGETLYQLAHELGIERPCRLYAPVGAHKELLPYLVRRFLENGANTSFVHQVLAEATRPELSNSASQHTLRQPNKLFLPRVSPALSDLYHWPDFIRLREDLNAQEKQRYIALPSNYIDTDGNTHLKTITNPALTTEIVGQYAETAFNEIETAFHTAELAQKKWQALGVSARAVLLEACADALEAKRVLLLDLLIREAGKTPINALQEFREAVDFCRYYAAQARSDWQHSCPAALGIVVAISPWNFPLAIFVGQIASALLAGNTVIAKPAPETPLIAAQAIECFYQAGIEPQVVQLLLGGGELGAALTYDHRCAGVCFTGSLNTAKQIRRALAEFGTDRVLVAETGGVNAMIVDSSAQIDQAIRDILISAFDSAGQRCSALRLLCVQTEIADELLARLKSCLHAIIVGSPSSASTEVGPIIRPKSRQAISQAIDTYLRLGYPICQTPLADQCQHGCFIAPTLIEIDQLKVLSEEIFGPVLCAYRYQAKQLDTLLEHLNQQGFGLTLGIHSRIKRNIEHIIANTRIGNYYVNRNQIGAVVETQPFGGQNKSGTGPKAGGPWAHWRLVRNADPCMPHYQILPSKLELLRQLANLWPDMDQGVDLEILLEDAARRSPIDQIIKLPAVSGETNELRYRGRGKVACFGPSDWDLIQQVGIAILTGNQAVITQPDLFRLWQKYLGPYDLIFSEKPLQLGVQAVLSHSLDADRIEKLLAQQDGAIIPLIQPFEDGKWPLFRLVAEYTVTTNTSATGGDVALLTQGAQ